MSSANKLIANQKYHGLTCFVSISVWHAIKIKFSSFTLHIVFSQFFIFTAHILIYLWPGQKASPTVQTITKTRKNIFHLNSLSFVLLFRQE